MTRDEKLNKITTERIALNAEIDEKKKQIYKLKDEIEELRDKTSRLQDKFNLKVTEVL